MLTGEQLKTLAIAQSQRPIASVFARTDPRDPANTASTPGWHIALRNGLAAVAERLESDNEREERLAFRELRERVERELIELEPRERARSVAWFISADGAISERFSLQLPLRSDAVVWNRKPFVSPLVDIADRGAPVGVVLVGGEVVRLLHLEQAETSEPPNSTYELELGDWRQFGGSAGGSPERGLQPTSHRERYEARVDAQRDQLFQTAATETARRLEALGWERIALVCEVSVAARFRTTLPTRLAERIIFESDRNLVLDDANQIADVLEPQIEDAWLKRTIALAELASVRARAGGSAALGTTETLSALAEGRVAQLLIDTTCDFSDTRFAPASIGGPASLLGERAVEMAVATGAQVTALSVDVSRSLRDAGGMAALLRY